MKLLIILSMSLIMLTFEGILYGNPTNMFMPPRPMVKQGYNMGSPMLSGFNRPMMSPGFIKQAPRPMYINQAPIINTRPIIQQTPFITTTQPLYTTIPASTTTIIQNPITYTNDYTKQCKIGGAYNHLCLMKNDDNKYIKDRFYQRYDCYRDAVCSYKEGKCQWLQTKKYKQCMDMYKNLGYYTKRPTEYTATFLGDF